MMEIFSDPALWVGVSFLLFVSLLGKRLYKMIGAMLDQRIAKITSNIAESKELRMQAEKILKEYQEKFGHAEQEARELLLQAQTEATLLQEQSLKNLELTLERRGQDALSKIEQSQQQLLQEMQAEIGALATQIIRSLLLEKNNKELSAVLFERSLKEVKAKINVA